MSVNFPYLGRRRARKFWPRPSVVLWQLVILTLFWAGALGQFSSGVSSGCYSLQGSKYCGVGFGDYQLSSFIQVGGVTVSNVAQFDRVLDQYFASGSNVDDINREFGCNGWDGTNGPRYRVSYLCRSYLAEPASQRCNTNNPPVPLCRSTCLEYTEGWTPMVTNTTACPSQGLTLSIWSDLMSTCDSSYYDGTADDQCVDGQKNEVATCGFLPTARDAICAYCTSSQDACCEDAHKSYHCDALNDNQDSLGKVTSANHSGLSPGQIVAIVLPSVLVALLLLALLAFFLHRRRKKQHKAMVSNLFHHVNPSSQRLLAMAPGAAAAAAVAARGAANGSSQSFEPVQCRAVYPFAPRMDDEIQLTPGDVLLLLKIFDDGWAVANNLTTGLEGAVPLVCVMPYHPDDAVDGDGAASTFGNKEGGSMAAIAQSPPLRDRGGSNGAHMAEKMAASPRSTTTRSQLHSARSTDAFGSRSFPDDSFNAAEIERSLSSLNASAAAIAATLSAATGSHTSSMMSPRASGTVHDSQLPRRHSSRTSTQPLRSLVNDNHHP